MASVSTLFDGFPTQILISDVRTGMVPLKASFGIDDQAWEKYETEYATLESSPVLPLAMKIPLHHALDQAAAVGEELFRKSGLNNEVYVPQGHWPFLGTVAARENTLFAAFGVMRSIHGDPPSRKHLQLAERLSVHMGRSLALAGHFSGKSPSPACFEEALQKLEVATIILNADGLIGWSNARAETMMAKGSLLSRRANMLVVNDHIDHSRLHRAIADAMQGHVITLLIGRSGNSAYVMRLQRLSTGQAFGQNNLMVTIKAARRRASFYYTEAAQLFGLTPAEARVACAICTSSGVDAAAQELTLSRNTIKTMLRRCFEKLGVRTQAELAMLFATSLAQFDELLG